VILSKQVQYHGVLQGTVQWLGNALGVATAPITGAFGDTQTCPIHVRALGSVASTSAIRLNGHDRKVVDLGEYRSKLDREVSTAFVLAL